MKKLTLRAVVSEGAGMRYNKTIKNLRALMQYAGMFKVEKILRQYLEVLL